MNCSLLRLKRYFFASAILSLFVPAIARAVSPPSPQSLQLPTAIAQNSPSDSLLSPLERQVLEEMNRARTNPSAYADWLESMKSYYYGNLLQLPEQPTIRTQEGVKAVDEAIRFLRAKQPLQPLRLSAGMSQAAKDHVNDIGSRGIIGHYGSDGSQFSDRLGRYGASSGAIGENISYGVTTAEAIVMQLIVDDGVVGRFHRENIFYNDFSATGVACGLHRRYEELCTIVYSADYRDTIASAPPTASPINPTRLQSESNTASAPITPNFAPAGTQASNPNLPQGAIVTVPPPPVNRTETPAATAENSTSNPAAAETSPVPAVTAENNASNPAAAETSPVPAVAADNSTSNPAAAETSPVPAATTENNASNPTAAETSPVPAVAAENNASNPAPATPAATPDNSASNPAAVETSPVPAATAANSDSISPATAVKTLLQAQGSLADGDSVYARDGSLYDVYTIQGRTGQTLTISVASRKFDTFLALFDAGDTIIGQNDDIDEKNTDSFLKVTLPKDGTYRIFINGYDARDRGDYTLTVLEIP
ncbi:CAP domain-containing protein [Oscillatoria sp. FACHB-1406]|uniref:CAP domain-containing protein n=1 Tax=Oscillatoria sp. FACHB-1406 TaxID=2692846 RepID=UPI0016892229|nr:CAP domain-containing protein [Oscillatoria sp. FACHB-1406]MBD2579145.1 pre-peptidase C-terminal domain-containing protein [Oscillatoria sp. FACHB-1406]